MESFSAEKNLARVSAGFKGGPMFESPNLAPKMTFADGWPAEIKQKMHGGDIPKMTMTDSWNSRRNK